MYVTRPLSMYLKNPASLSLPPPEGPNSGILVIQDEESEPTCCFGLCKDREIMDLPIPQNKNITIRYSSGVGTDQNKQVSKYHVILIPVLNQPLSANQYYAIRERGRHRGEAHANSNEEDLATCCFCNFVQDVKTRPFDPRDIYLQFEISPLETLFGLHGSFVAQSVAPDGFPPYFMRRKGWQIYTKTPKNYQLGEAPGVNTALRARHPDFNFPLSYKSSETVVVGKWYCPFMFIRDGALRDQFKRSTYYEMTLEQRWEQIFACDNNYSQGNAVTVDIVVQREVVSVAGREALRDAIYKADGMMWFKNSGIAGGEVSVGLSLAIVERMKWEQERVGWIGGSDRQTKVKRTEEFKGLGEWRKFGCYILVERFVLKRMDGSLVLTYDFKHTHQVKSKWE